MSQQIIESIYSSKFSSIDIDSMVSDSRNLNLKVISTKIDSYPQAPSSPSKLYFKKLLHLSHKEQLASLPKTKPQKKSELYSQLIKNLQKPSKPGKTLFQDIKIDPSLVDKLNHFNRIEDLKAFGDCEDLEIENERLRAKLKEIEKIDFIKRQVFKLAAKEINSDKYKS